MSKKRHGLSKEEIAKQFMLPERKSKIATLLKQDGQAYCICRSSDSSRFMIGCDACEEWYHGDCINITEKDAKYIKQFFCVRCREEDSTLITRYKPRKTDQEDRRFKKYRDKDGRSGGNSSSAAATGSSTGPGAAGGRRYEYDEPWVGDSLIVKKSSQSSKRCGECNGCLRNENCGKCDPCRHLKKFGPSVRLKLRCIQRTCRSIGAIPLKPSKSLDKNRFDKPIKKRKRDSSNERTEQLLYNLLDTPRQCYGPTCIRQSRVGSKYCSDECGLKLATNRIYQVLPQRIQEWSLTSCVAEQNNQHALESVRKQQQDVKIILQELDKRHAELDRIVERAKNATIDPNYEIDDNDDTEMSMYCITCGHEIHSRTAIKHMEKCFNKYESQASFGSIFKTRIEGQVMFCDFFNPINRTYCKRLRVLCPEHCKDPKINDTQVCGCPLVTNVFDMTGEFCRAPKKSCVKHYVWEKLRRAEIDMERVRQWLKIDELVEQERQIRSNMATRAGVLALMLHSTYNHELMEQMTQEQNREQLKAMEEELERRYSQFHQRKLKNTD
ncbi:CXXC-type zinc finger protein 1-like [Microplitis mediator]|uniref:CXXC-type zinc finger protein 1-like n=1 Tax=Microplitis mediator TaxID=375433 RepID=UPI002555FB91|nr:CXXC-type zinc finger protein 1-like [Microplitis mediator]XP_057341134.1 CXXC-type zinc finger protein 1-like [Microplitis mediator]